MQPTEAHAAPATRYDQFTRFRLTVILWFVFVRRLGVVLLKGVRCSNLRSYGVWSYTSHHLASGGATLRHRQPERFFACFAGTYSRTMEEPGP